jgi:anti-anti-sigma regulatory factor
VPPGRFRVLACGAWAAGAAIVLIVDGVLGEPDGELADRVESLVASGTHVVVDVTRVDGADVATVAALARLQLRRRASGGSICLRGPSPGLRAVLTLLGFDDVLPLEGGR